MIKPLLSSQHIFDCIKKRNYESNNENTIIKKLNRNFNHIWFEKLEKNIGTNIGSNFLRIDQLKTFLNLKYHELYLASLQTSKTT